MVIRSQRGMSRYFSTLAYSLRWLPRGDDDRVYTLYTTALGKLDAVAAGSQKILSKLAGHLEPFGEVVVTLVQRGQTTKLTGAVCRRRFGTMSQFQSTLEAAARCLRLVRTLTPEAIADRGVFALLQEALRILETGPVVVAALVPHFFALKLLARLGYQPHCTTCVHCRRPILPAGNHFDPTRGGIICPACVTVAHPDRLPVGPETLTLLRLALTAPWPELVQVRPNRLAAAGFVTVVEQFIAYHQ